ncbi:hypothetical protein HaLaN_31323 [Haematococcus lacustris]|uniref:Uncharacterized protein n=1 Tax=Haematococcus lacustris TaxID=44745 RepID=A0A6A0AIN2_HAELA|nr:hypothetical protein HaLaN_31323 [Haematococcus lacustris]
MASATVSSADHLGKLQPESSDVPMLQQQTAVCISTSSGSCTPAEASFIAPSEFTAAVDAAAAARARALVGTQAAWATDLLQMLVSGQLVAPQGLDTMPASILNACEGLAFMQSRKGKSQARTGSQAVQLTQNLTSAAAGGAAAAAAGGAEAAGGAACSAPCCVPAVSPQPSVPRAAWERVCGEEAEPGKLQPGTGGRTGYWRAAKFGNMRTMHVCLRAEGRRRQYGSDLRASWAA